MSKNWEYKALAKACEVFVDGNWIESKDQSPTGIRLVQTGNIGQGEYLDKSNKSRFISEDTFHRLKCTEVLPGDILVSRLPDPVGRSCVLPDIGLKMITGVDCTIIRTKNILQPNFLKYYQLSIKYLKDVDSRTTGTTRNRISRKNLGLVKVPIPSIDEQKQIVAILDKAFAAIDQAKANVERNLQNAKELFQSKLNEVFSQKGEGWGEYRFGSVCAFVRGPFGGSLKKSIFVPDGIAVYEQQHAIYNQFNNIRYFISDSKFREMKRFEVFPGDLIMSCSGTMGKVAIVPSNIRKGIINQALLKLSPQDDLVPQFLKFWMESDDFQKQLTQNVMGAAIKNVASVKVLKEITVPIPDLSTQKQIVLNLTNILDFTDGLLKIQKSKLANIEELQKSILQKAFNGELNTTEA